MTLGSHATATAVVIAIDVLMALSLYLPISTGSLFIVPIGSMGVGAYVAGELALHSYGATVAFLAAAGAGAVVCLLGGLIVARMRPWSGAIATFAIVEVIQVVFQHASVIGGANGLLGIPLFTSSTAILAFTIGAVLILLSVDLSRVGDIVEAIRSDELAAECSGIRVVRARLTAFTVAGVLAGIAGATSAGFLGFVDPGTYGLVQLNGFLIGTILGGSTTALGSLFGGIVVNIVPQVAAAAANYTLIVSSAVVIVIILVRNEGLITRRALKHLVRRLGRAVGRRAVTDRLPRRDGKRPRYLAKRPRYTTLRASGMQKAFGGAQVVRDVEIELCTGEVVGIIGANGAGKTTLVNLLTGVVHADRGEVTAEHPNVRKSARRLHPQRAVQLGIARTFQAGRLYRGLTTAEHVSLIRGADTERLLELVGLSERTNDEATSLPYGDQRLLEIARALATDPTFLILDEPCAGMTLTEMDRVAELVGRLRSNGLGVMIVDHNVEFISALSDRMVAMHFGEVIARGAPAEILENERVITAYLGADRTADTQEENELLDELELGEESTPATTSRPSPVTLDSAATTSAPDRVLYVEDLVVRYGPVTAVRGITIELKSGEARAVIGSNGAGKTSLLRAICGLVPIVDGRIELAGADMTSARPEDRARSGIALVPEGRGVFSSMSVLDNILVAGGRDRGIRDRADRLFETFPLLAELRHRRAGLLSGGEQQVLAVARALMTEPKVVLLDEPSMGLSPVAVKVLLEALAKLGSTGPALLLVEQNARLAFELASHVYAMQHGAVTLDGTFADLIADDALRHIYLGRSFVTNEQTGAAK